MLAACQPGGDAAADPTTPATAAGGGGAGGGGASAECGGSADTLDGALKVITGPIGCPGGVNTFWSQKLGSGWTVPRFIEYHDGDIPQDECGAQSRDPDDFASNAFYCSLDDTVAYSVEFMAELSKQDPSYPMLVLMHELGHRVSALTDKQGVVSRSEENQADCLAGSEAKFTHDAGRFPMANALEGIPLFFQLGDGGGAWLSFGEPNADPEAHGNPSQRTAAAVLGYTKGIDTCFKIGQSADGGISLTDSLFG
ncbi:metalloprotease [Pseudofrankia asymbiotica]|uniref:Metalloprotease n=2 Tax=Pseudofrankia asymbiotica TaxID=1834516 RepID=A0A1V2HZP2_9ACTN|nr:metalloprotease [Pseudofrankia asymbiotica]